MESALDLSNTKISSIWKKRGENNLNLPVSGVWKGSGPRLAFVCVLY